jgi:glutamate synthase (NADPH/NADH) large chain
VQRFTKVLPRDYRLVLEIRDAAREEGLDPDSNEVFTRITEVSHG